MKNYSGFTLLETLIYIALFSLILVGGFVTAFELVQSSELISARKVATEESYFVMKKINWTLDNTSTVAVLSSNTLKATKYDGTVIVVTFDSGKVAMKENSSDFIPLTTDNVSVDGLEFQYLTPTPDYPPGVIAILNIDGLVSTTTRYLKQ